MDYYTIILVSTLFCFFMISTGRSEIAITEQGSWLSPDSLAHILELSLKQSRCANVHVSGDSLAIETIFQYFTRIYSGEYVLMNTTHDCYGHLMISASADQVATILKRFPEKPSTEILVIIDDEVDESSIIFNGSWYGHANVHIVSQNGLRRLSENFLEPRIFVKIFSYHEILRKRGSPNFHGRELQATAYYNPPYSYLRTTQNRTIRGIEAQVYGQKNDNLHNNGDASSISESELDGVEVKLFLLMAQKLNFTWTIRRPGGHNPFGAPNGTHWVGGMIGQLFQKEVDIAITDVWLTLSKSEYTNQTLSWTQESIHFLVPRPKSHRTLWALTIPFSARVWIATFIMIMAQSICVYVKAWIGPKVPRRFRNFFVTMTELIGRLLGGSITKRIPGLKVQFQLWHFIGILLVTAYSSNLAASLASLEYEPRIDTTKDLVAANLTWGEPDGMNFPLHFDESDPYAIEFLKRFETENDEAERHARIVRGNYAILGKVLDGVFLPEHYVRNSDLKNYRAMRDPTVKYHLVFAVQPWLLEPVNKVISRLRDAGIIEYHLRDVIRRREPPERQEVFVEYDVGTGEPRVLQLIPLTAGFAVLIVGLAISSVVFYLELRYASGKTSVRQLLRRIEQKRKIEYDRGNMKKRRILLTTRLSSRKYGFS